MISPRSAWTVALIAVACLAAPRPAAAQDASRAYAAGVQAFFNGSASRAEAMLDQAIALSPNDARAYYFRGLAKMRQGRRGEGESDLQIGASIEAGRPERFLGMGTTLQRVQGGDRLLLERIRRETRQGMEQAQRDDDAQRYQPSAPPEPPRAKAPFRLPLSVLDDNATPDSLAALVAAQADSPTDPFADEAAPQDAGVAAAVERPRTPVDIPEEARGAVSAKQLGGIFGGMLRGLLPATPPLPGAAPPAEGGPFAGPADAPFGGSPEAGDPFGDDGEDPFGASSGSYDAFGAAPADDDPFGGETEEPSMPADPPADDPFGGASDDPFGGGEDPFGGDDPFGGEDPFGE